MPTFTYWFGFGFCAGSDIGPIVTFPASRLSSWLYMHNEILEPDAAVEISLGIHMTVVP